MVARVFNFLYREVKGLHQAAYILALFTLASQILAVVRDRILAHQFGAGEVLDVYYSAFRIPDTLYVLFASVLSVYVLLPFVVEASAKNKEEARRVISQVFSVFLVCYVLMAGLALIFAPNLSAFIFPGFSPEMQSEVASVLQILLLQPLLLGVSSLAGVVTQMQHRFVVYALSPLLYNLGIIAGALWGYDIWGINGLAYGVILGALGHLAIQLPLLCKSALTPRFTFKFDLDLFVRITKIALPRALTLSLHQLQFIFFVFLGSFMTVGSVSVLQFAYNLQSVPLAVIGASYSVAAFPSLALLVVEKRLVEFQKYVLTAIKHIIFWSIPILFLMIVLRAHIVRVILGSGEFDWDATRLTAAVMGVFVLTLTVQSVLFLLIRAFYAAGEAKWPLIASLTGVSIGSLVAYVSYLSLQNNLFIQEKIAVLLRLDQVNGLEVLALPFGFVVGLIFELLLVVFIFKKVFAVNFCNLWRSVWHATLAGLGGALASYGVLQFVVEGVNQSKFMGVLVQGGLAFAFGVATTILVYYFLKSPELAEVYSSFRRKILKTDVIAPQPDVI